MTGSDYAFMRLRTETAEDRANRIDALVHIRHLLKIGKPDDAREELERVLGDLDSAWRTRWP